MENNLPTITGPNQFNVHGNGPPGGWNWNNDGLGQGGGGGGRPEGSAQWGGMPAWAVPPPPPSDAPKV